MGVTEAAQAWYNDEVFVEVYCTATVRDILQCKVKKIGSRITSYLIA
jgi:hypothetical protein